MKNSIYGVLFFLIFLGLSCILTIVFMPNTPPWSVEKAMTGTWNRQVETSILSSSPTHHAIRRLWGVAEWSLFHQGRKGAFAGDDGWLYADEELYCRRQDRKTLEVNIARIADIHRLLEKEKIHVLAVVVPAKARFYGQIPACRERAYQEAMREFSAIGIKWVDGENILKTSREPFLKHDTHWSPEGAAMVAQKTAKDLTPVIRKARIKRMSYKIIFKGTQQHEGDLTRYFPGVEPEREKVERYAAQMSGRHSIGLLDDYVPEVVLAGTSYSQNPLWNFEGFLKKFLRTDILNVSQQEKGPLQVMDEYLNGDHFRNNPPKIIIWEIPERFLFAGS